MQNTITSMEDLAEKIKALQEEEKIKTVALKAQAAIVMDGFKPSSLLKSAVSDITASRSLKEGAIDTTIGMGAGWLVRKLYQANSKNIFRKLTGFVLQSITTGFVTSKIPNIRHKVAKM